jgi:hypothetical protein
MVNCFVLALGDDINKNLWLILILSHLNELIFAAGKDFF